MFGEGISYLPYHYFIASHSALTNVINLTNLTYNPSSSTQGNYPPVTSTLMCNFDSTSNDPQTTSTSTTEFTSSSSERESTSSENNTEIITTVDDYIVNLETELQVQLCIYALIFIKIKIFGNL